MAQRDAFQLEYDERVVREFSNVEQIGGGFLNGGQNDDLVLTNKRIVHVQHGIFGGVRNVTSYALRSIKVVDGKVQVSRSGNDFASQEVSLYLNHSTEKFKFENPMAAAAFVNEVTCAITGEDPAEVARNTVMAGATAVAETIGASLDAFATAFGLKQGPQTVTRLCPSCGGQVTGLQGQSQQCEYCGAYIQL